MYYKRFHLNLIQLDAVDSTNNYAANLFKGTNVVNGTTILTKRQENGRGQRGNVWISEPNKNLIVSTLLHPNIKSENLFLLNIAVSLAVKSILADYSIKATVKWPNDIYVGDKKIAGILIENQVQGTTVSKSILGLGLNVNQLDFPAKINATSVALENTTVELEALFNNYYGKLDHYVDLVMRNSKIELMKAYKKALFRMNVWANYIDETGEFLGQIIDVTAAGQLVVQVESEVRSYNFKEIKYQI